LRDAELIQEGVVKAVQDPSPSATHFEHPRVLGGCANEVFVPMDLVVLALLFAIIMESLAPKMGPVNREAEEIAGN